MPGFFVCGFGVWAKLDAWDGPASGAEHGLQAGQSGLAAGLLLLI